MEAKSWIGLIPLTLLLHMRMEPLFLISNMSPHGLFWVGGNIDFCLNFFFFVLFFGRVIISGGENDVVDLAIIYFVVEVSPMDLVWVVCPTCLPFCLGVGLYIVIVQDVDFEHDTPLPV